MTDFENNDLCTPQPDPRFHNQNVTAWCYSSFVDHKKCTRLLGEGYVKEHPYWMTSRYVSALYLGLFLFCRRECCKQFEKIYRSICPSSWTERWEEQIKIGTFPADLPEPCNGK
ncbi:cytochrome c oxidase subunit 6B2-like isoform X1 [Cylas formicarius]|uniref:cytochrome c oxidase subunit 6B2-like isoform X1 n=1 Tax=Cylas formicarius TaxID=197179 RepID=UPI002958A212|nr:cytochrome c oxidase subunit 6B2-like isoform X1 [Cylas formicarius]